MTSKVVLFSFAFVAITILAVYPHWYSNRSWNLPPVASKITQPRKQEAKTGIDCYGEFSFVLDPESKIAGQNSRINDWRAVPSSELTYTTFEDGGLSFVLECHQCYGDSAESQTCSGVSGGSIKVSSEKSEWVLRFHHVGAESAFYSDELPPLWVRNWVAESRQEIEPRDFLPLFESLYNAAEENDSDSQRLAAKKVIGRLVWTFANHFLDENGKDST